MQLFETININGEDSGQPFDILIDSVNKQSNELKLKVANNGVTIIAGFKNGEYSNFQTAKDKLRKFGKNKELKNYMIKIKPLLEFYWKNKITDYEFLLAVKFIKQGYDVLEAVDKAANILEQLVNIHKLNLMK